MVTPAGIGVGVGVIDRYRDSASKVLLYVFAKLSIIVNRLIAIVVCK
ncbi:hypothetical protein VXS04_07090 [Photobacterium piscicola]|nr:hypothetical protein [Photobacterium piscicola]